MSFLIFKQKTNSFKRWTSFSILLILSQVAMSQVETSNHFNLRKISTHDSIHPFDVHFQTTYIYQYKPLSQSNYDGINSLQTNVQHQNSQTTTLYFGVRLWNHGQIYINPEIAGGSGISGAMGMGGSTNGETFRVGNPSPTLYFGRAYFQQTFNFKPTQTYINEDANQLGDFQSTKYLKLLIGKFCLGDIFDHNACSNSPRNQFLNWSAMNNGAWDYAADVRGYTYATVAIYQNNNWNFKFAAAALPKTANGPDLNTNYKQSLALNAEFEYKTTINNLPGNYRILVYQNKTNMGNYDQAIIGSVVTNISLTRTNGRLKRGIGISADQAITSNSSIFTRLGYNDGKNETWCFTEIDNTLLLGIVITGKKYNMPENKLGICFISNGLSQPHQNYLKNGGSGFILGDGNLNYQRENILECYYIFKPSYLPIWFTADYQYCKNPGYNSDRGSVNVFSLRMHVEM